MKQLDYMNRTTAEFRVTYTNYKKEGNTEVLTTYILYNQKGEVEYSLKDESYSQAYFLVKDVYRFYRENGIDTKQTKMEISYQSKTYNTDPIRFNEIKSFLITPQPVTSYVHEGDNWVSKTEILPTTEKAFRVDTLVGDEWQSKIEVGSVHDSGYKCFNKCKFCNRFKLFDDFYVGGLADMSEIDALPNIIDEINNYEKKFTKLNKRTKVLSLRQNIV